VALVTKNKNISNTKKIQILNLLRELEQNSKILNTFSKQGFENPDQMKETFLQILKTIKTDMISIKNILNS